jgi:DNA-binding transcriptional regulator/RsmH inhibitor MraZ
MLLKITHSVTFGHRTAKADADLRLSVPVSLDSDEVAPDIILVGSDSVFECWSWERSIEFMAPNLNWSVWI